MKTLISCTLAVLLLFLPCQSAGGAAPRRQRAADASLTSPPLPGSLPDHERLKVSVPPGWRISRKDPIGNWRFVEYNLEITHPTGRTVRVGKGHSKRLPDTLNVGVLQWALSRAKRHEDFEGTRFRTKSGLRGILKQSTFGFSLKKPISHEWKLAIPVQSTDSALIIEVNADARDRRSLEPVALEVLRSVRFIHAGRHVPRRCG